MKEKEEKNNIYYYYATVLLIINNLSLLVAPNNETQKERDRTKMVVKTILIKMKLHTVVFDFTSIYIYIFLVKNEEL